MNPSTKISHLRSFGGRALLAIVLFCLAVYGDRIMLVENGVPTARIVLPAGAGPVLEKAAKELSFYVKKMSGVDVPIRSDGTRGRGTALVLGDADAVLPAVVSPNEQYALETFSYRVSDGNVYFGGRSPEAVTYAVLAFLEDCLGVRWFGPGDLWEYLPPHQRGELTVDVSSRVVTPDTPLRIISCSGIDASWETWLWRNRARSMTTGIRNHFSSNTIQRMFPVEKYAEAHPEYYPLIGGKRWIPPSGKLGRYDLFWPCVSNPEVVNIVVEYLRNWFDSHPEVHSFSLAMNDVTRHCGCPACRAMDRNPEAFRAHDLTDRTCAFLNAVARELKKSHPHRYLGVLFYRQLLIPPTNVNTLESTIFGYLTCDPCSWWGEEGARCEAANRSLTKAWARVSSLPLSRYTYFGQGTFTPLFNPHAVDRQMKLDLDLGLEGQYTEFYTFLPNTIPLSWAFFRLQWKADQDIDTLLREFYDKMFGEAAGAMADYYAFLERVWNTPRPGRVAKELVISRNVEQQCLGISPADIQEGFRLLDRALAATGRDDVRTRIGIIRASLRFAQVGVDTFWQARKMRSARIEDLAQARRALTAMGEYAERIDRRTAFWAEAEKRKDLLGESIRALKRRHYLMADSLAFGRMDNALIPFQLNVLDWYRENAPTRLPEARSALAAMTLPEAMSLAANAYAKALVATNLLTNPGFEELGPATLQENANADWDNTHAPKGWSVWIRPVGRKGLPPSVPGIREKAGRHASKAAGLSAGTGGCFIATLPVQQGEKYLASVWMRAGSPEAAAKAHLTLKFKDGNGRLMSRDAYNRVRYEQIYGVATTDWQRLATCASVPKEARTLCLMLGHEGSREGDVVFDDAFLLLAEAAPKKPASPNLEALLAEGEFKRWAKDRLSGRGVRQVVGRNGNAALAFSPGERGENSYIQISGVADHYDMTKAMTVEAWIRIDPAYKKGTLEIVGNPVTDRGKGFRLYVNRGILHFISGTGGVWKEAKTWGAQSDAKHVIEPGVWHHVAATYDGSIFRILVDGQLAGESEAGLPLTKGKPDLCVGSFRHGLVYGFRGAIAGLDVHGRALSAEEIKRKIERRLP